MVDMRARVTTFGSVHGRRLRPAVAYFEGRPEQVGRIREHLRGELGDHPAAEPVLLVVSELAANALQHTASGSGGKVGVACRVVGELVFAAVADEGSTDTLPCLCGRPSGEDEHDRGLPLVRALSLRMGWVSLGELGAFTWFVCGSNGRRLASSLLTPMVAVMEAVLFPAAPR